MMKTRLILLLTSSLLLLSAVSYSQENERCRQDEVFNELKANDPVLYNSIREQLRKHTEEGIEIGKNRKQKSATNFVIPVVFHILHYNGAEMISEAQVLDAVRILNEDFSAMSPDTGDIDPLFWPIYADVGIEFRLAQIDPNGNCSNGINYYEDPKNMHGETCDWGEVQRKWSPNQWDYDKYLNIYTLKDGGSWSYGPLASNSYSGVGIDHFYVGSIGTFSGAPYYDRTLTHEVGHWLNLPHTWGSGSIPGSCDLDDGIDDTPTTKGTWGCDLDINSCDDGIGDLKDNVQNYMDYGCSIMFTEGQKTTMINSLLSSNQYNLQTQENLINTGTADPYVYGSTPCPPRIEINMDTEEALCPGSTASFSYYHHNAVVDSVLWKFPGGSPDTSSLDKPDIHYAASGTYDATLTAYASGFIATDTLIDAVKINTLDGGIPFPFVETFEDQSAFDSLWTIINPNGDKFTWKNIVTSSYTGHRSIRMRNSPKALNGRVDEIISPFIDLSSSPDSTVLTFMIAAGQNGNARDKLEVYFSRTCGDSWQRFYSKKGTELSTVTSSLKNYVPTSISDWRQEYIKLPLEYNVPDVQFKFLFKSNLGSNLYIDDINYTIVGINDISIDRSLRIFPNPIGPNSVISFDLLNLEEVVVEVYDLLGREISKRNYGNLSAGSHQLSLGKDIASQKGIFIVKIRFDKEVVTRKVLVE